MRLLICAAMILSFGCATKRHLARESRGSLASSDIFEASAKPANCKSLACRGFEIEVTNRSESPIEIDWGRTLFIVDGQTNGTFIREGHLVADRDKTAAPDVVMPGRSWRATVLPLNLMKRGTKGGLVHAVFPTESIVGVMLNVRQGENAYLAELLSWTEVRDGEDGPNGFEHTPAKVFDDPASASANP